jgi:hypothetical protein
MRLTITINLDNEAFAPEPGEEVSRILNRVRRELADRHLADLDGLNLQDLNGNTVGSVKVAGKAVRA